MKKLILGFVTVLTMLTFTVTLTTGGASATGVGCTIIWTDGTPPPPVTTV